jgi:hypothetical protein
MATQLQMRRGTQSEHSSFTGAEGEVSVNTTNDSLHVHDGSTASGFELARADLNNVSDTDLNAALTGNTIGSLTITTADITNFSLGGVSVTSTAAELNYVDGVTSAIQTQIDTKAPLASPTFTGTVTADGLTSQGTLGNWSIDSQGAIQSFTRASTNYIRASNAAGALRFDTGGSNARLNIASNGDISFYEDTGTTPKFFWDASAESLGIGTSSPDTQLEVSNAASAVLRLSTSDTSVAENQELGALEYSQADISGAGGGVKASIRAKADNSTAAQTYLAFHTSDSSANDVERMRIDSAGNVGIGTSSPSEKLEIRNDVDASTDLDPTAIKLYNNSDGGSAIEFSNGVAGKSKISFGVTSTGAGTDDSYLGFSTGANAGLSEAMRIDSSGNLLVGTTTSSGKLTVDGDTRLKFTYPIADNSYDLGTSSFRWRDLYLSGAANVGGNIVSSANNFIYSHNGGSSGTVRSGFKLEGSSNTLVFYTGATERARIDSSGNLLVGTTDAAVGVGNTNVGHSIGAAGYAAHSRSGNASLFLNRTGTDGIIASFRKDGAPVGSIGAAVGNAYFSGTARGWTFGGSNLYPANQVGAKQDNNTDLGHGSYRFDDIYATNGTIQTSDRNEKQDIEALSDAEQRVAVAAKGLLRKFRWINSVEENGDDARIHFGIIAQDLQDAFTAEGLDAGRYAMFISSTWTDEDGNEQTRLGVRYSELLAFIISAT